jgi:glyoxylase-like metal-dependent hydrolase (beta-lactamase superfamily II)
MPPYTLITHTGGDLATNAYLLSVPGFKGEGRAITLCFDAPEGTLDALRKHALEPSALVLTHGHFDHIIEAASIAQAYACPVYIHPDDAFMIENPELFSIWGIQGILPVKAWQPLSTPRQGTALIQFEKLSAQLFHIPGHSPGSVAIYFSQWDLLFGGDILFAGGIGRWDLPGGNEKSLIDGIRHYLLALPDGTRVLPGHGPATTIGEERRSNPYITL